MAGRGGGREEEEVEEGWKKNGRGFSSSLVYISIEDFVLGSDPCSSYLR